MKLFRGLAGIFVGVCGFAAGLVFGGITQVVQTIYNSNYLVIGLLKSPFAFIDGTLSKPFKWARDGFISTYFAKEIQQEKEDKQARDQEGFRDASNIFSNAIREANSRKHTPQYSQSIPSSDHFGPMFQSPSSNHKGVAQPAADIQQQRYHKL